MNKEPIGLYIFRYVLGLGMFAFMCMLYWSSTLIEHECKILRYDIAQLKNDLFALHSDTDRVRSDVLQTILNERSHMQEIVRQAISCSMTASAVIPPEEGSKKTGKSPSSIHPEMDPNLPNLLQADLFFDQTLPNLLGSDFVPHGVQQSAVITKPNNLHPFSNWAQVAAWNDLCNVTVAKLQFGKYETLAPNMAIKVEERTNPSSGIPEYWVFLRDNVFWQPLKTDFFSGNIHLAPQFLRKNQVTAEDFKFFFDALMNPFVQEPQAVALRTYYNSIQDVEIIDKLTFVVRWKAKLVKGPDGKDVPKIKYSAKGLTGQLRPLASFVYKYFADGKKIIDDDADPNAYRTNSVWAQNFAEHWAKNAIISCGPWIFDGMTDRQIKFKRNPDFFLPYAALTSAMVVDFKASPDNVWQDFKIGHLDTYTMPPDQLLELADFLQAGQYQEQVASGDAIERLDYVARSYAYIGWNEAKPFFKSRKVRQALTMTIDRQRIIQENLHGMGIEITGTFYRYSPSYDDSIPTWPHDVQKAKRMLEEEGWYDSTGSGVIDKLIDGKRTPFSFSLTYYVKNPTAKSICDYIATAFKEIGIDCRLNGVDIADLSAVFDDKGFDALFLAWSLGTPPEDPRQLWHSAGAKEKGSSNMTGFSNPEVDAIIDELDYEYDPERRKVLYYRFDAIINEEQPYTFLYTPKAAFLYRQYVQNVFLPAQRQDLVPGANMTEPDPTIFWLKKLQQK